MKNFKLCRVGTAHQNPDMVGSAQRPTGAQILQAGNPPTGLSHHSSQRGEPRSLRARVSLLATSLRALFVAPLRVFLEFSPM